MWPSLSSSLETNLSLVIVIEKREREREACEDSDSTEAPSWPISYMVAVVVVALAVILLSLSLILSRREAFEDSSAKKRILLKVWAQNKFQIYSNVSIAHRVHESVSIT